MEQEFNTQQHDTIQAIARILKSTNSILFITGAGVSADSGLPTYRGIGGLYDASDPEEGIPIEQILSGPMLRGNPELTWKYLAQIGQAAHGGTFNRAHEVIVEMERHFERVWTLTQNIDGYHHAAGSEKLIEIHGHMRTLTCLSCTAKIDVDSLSEQSLPPKCSNCDGIMRPDVVLFEEMLPEAAIMTLQRELTTGFGVIFVVGTSAGFPYIQQPVYQARTMGVPTIEINPAETPISHVVDYRLDLRAAVALDAIQRARQSQ